MQSLADNILELLYYRDTDQIFAEFCHELKLLESPISKFDDLSPLTHYLLTELGVSIYSFDRDFFSADFYIEPASVDGITTNRYCNALPFGIKTDHTISDIHSLLGPPQEVSKSGSESYRLEPWDVVFWYLKPSGKLSTVIVSRYQTTRVSKT